MASSMSSADVLSTPAASWEYNAPMLNSTHACRDDKMKFGTGVGKDHHRRMLGDQIIFTDAVCIIL